MNAQFLLMKIILVQRWEQYHLHIKKVAWILDGILIVNIWGQRTWWDVRHRRHYHFFTLSFLHTIISSHYHFFTLSFLHTIISSHYHFFTLSFLRANTCTPTGILPLQKPFCVWMFYQHNTQIVKYQQDVLFVWLSVQTLRLAFGNQSCM